jgi:hypothetical protein
VKFLLPVLRFPLPIILLLTRYSLGTDRVVTPILGSDGHVARIGLEICTRPKYIYQYLIPSKYELRT